CPGHCAGKQDPPPSALRMSAPVRPLSAWAPRSVWPVGHFVDILPRRADFLAAEHQSGGYQRLLYEFVLDAFSAPHLDPRGSLIHQLSTRAFPVHAACSSL